MESPNNALLKQLFAYEVIFSVSETKADIVPPALPVVVEQVVPIETKKQETPIPPQQDAPLTWAYKQKVLLLVSEPQAELLREADLVFLEKVLAAVQLTLKDVDILNIDSLKGTDFKPLLAAKSLHHVITFGVPLTRLRLEILLVPYQIKQLEGINFLYADSLASLQQDVNRKRAFWSCIKQMFNVVST